jgi:hypothetical protein
VRRARVRAPHQSATIMPRLLVQSPGCGRAACVAMRGGSRHPHLPPRPSAAATSRYLCDQQNSSGEPALESDQSSPSGGTGATEGTHALKQSILRAALVHVPSYGWSPRALAAGVADQQLSTAAVRTPHIAARRLGRRGHAGSHGHVCCQRLGWWTVARWSWWRTLLTVATRRCWRAGAREDRRSWRSL